MNDVFASAPVSVNAPIVPAGSAHIRPTSLKKRNPTPNITHAIADGQALAAFSGIEFGKNMYYLTGGSEADNGGAAWHLMLMVIRRAYDRTHGSGKFLMGIAQNGPIAVR